MKYELGTVSKVILRPDGIESALDAITKAEAEIASTIVRLALTNALGTYQDTEIGDLVASGELITGRVAFDGGSEFIYVRLHGELIMAIHEPTLELISETKAKLTRKYWVKPKKDGQ